MRSRSSTISGTVSYSQLGAMAAGIGMYLGMQTHPPGLACFCRPARHSSPVSTERCWLARPLCRLTFFLAKGNRPHHQGQRDRHRPDVTSLARQIKGYAAQSHRPAHASQTPPPDDQPSFPARRGRYCRPDVHQRHQRPAQGRVAQLRKSAERRRCGESSTRSLQREHRFLGVIPLFHSFGMIAMMIAPIQLGATVGLLGTGFSPSHGAQGDPRAQHFAHVGGAEHVSGRYPSQGCRPRRFQIASTPCHQRRRAAARRSAKRFEKFGVPIYEGYGLTETRPGGVAERRRRNIGPAGGQDDPRRRSAHRR